MNEWLRRSLQSSRISADLDRVTEIDDELETAPGTVGVDPGAVEAVWEQVQALYRTGTHPGIQITLRHRGEVLLQRSLGHSQGNGPMTGLMAPKSP